MDIYELYQQFNHRIEKVDFEKTSMIDEIRNKAFDKKAVLREAYLVEQMEDQFKDLSIKALDITKDDVSAYVFTPDGLELVSVHNMITELVTWEEMKQGYVNETC